MPTVASLASLSTSLLMNVMITGHVCSWLQLTRRCLGALQADRSSKWRVEVGWSHGRSLISATFIHRRVFCFTDTPPHPHPHLPMPPVCLRCVPRLQVHQLLPLLTPSLIGSYAPTFFHVSGSSGPHFSPGFTLLGDGPVAVAVVVRWPVCVGRQGATEAGTEDTGEWAEPGGILLFYYAVWSGCRLMLL